MIEINLEDQKTKNKSVCCLLFISSWYSAQDVNLQMALEYVGVDSLMLLGMVCTELKNPCYLSEDSPHKTQFVRKSVIVGGESQ
jgi:hypothetical protein